jgi:hypothetical protein
MPSEFATQAPCMTESWNRLEALTAAVVHPQTQSWGRVPRQQQWVCLCLESTGLPVVEVQCNVHMGNSSVVRS